MVGGYSPWISEGGALRINSLSGFPEIWHQEGLLMCINDVMTVLGFAATFFMLGVSYGKDHKKKK